MKPKAKKNKKENIKKKRKEALEKARAWHIDRLRAKGKSLKQKMSTGAGTNKENNKNAYNMQTKELWTGWKKVHWRKYKSKLENL
jgi:hypothetical protein